MGVKTGEQITCSSPSTSTGEMCNVTGEQQLQLVSNPVVVQSNQITNEEVECLRELRRLIKEDEFVRESGVSDDEELLLAFVRGSRCNAEKAIKTLHNHVHVMRVKYSKFFQNLSPRKFRYLLDYTTAPRMMGILKNTDAKGRVVGIALSSPFNHRVHKADDIIETMVTAGLELLRTYEGPANGLVLVIDAKGFGFRHAREFHMSRLYLFLSIFLSAYPVKYKGFHILNNAYLFDTILTLVKQLIPKKLRDRIHLHGSNLESLHEHVPASILPEHFGGTLKDDEAYDLDFEQRVLDKTEFYEKLGQNW